MLIDIIALGLLVLAAFKGLRKGLIVAVFSFLAFIVGLAAALKLSAVAAGYIGEAISISQRWLPVLAFFVVFLVVVLLIRLGARLLEGVVQVAMLGWLNRIGGMIFYMLMYFFIYSVLLFYAVQLGVLKKETTGTSVVYPYLEPFAPAIIRGLGVIFPFFKNLFGQLLDFFGGVSETKR
jgi:membrane protein required for colicin V production